MAQEIKRRLFSSRKVILALLALALIGAAMLALTVFAQGDIILSLGSAEGYEGTTVKIPVTITNCTNVAGVTVKIYYDESIVEPEMIEDPWNPGNYIPNVELGTISHPTATFFSANKRSDELGEYLHIVVASTYKFSGDGTIYTIPMILKNKGSSNLVFDVETLSDDEAGSLENYTTSNGTITVLSRQVAQVEKPVWDGDVIKWTNVENAANYEVKLYNMGVSVDTQTVAQGIAGQQNSYNFGAKIASEAPGVFTVTVQAKGADPWTDGDVSEHSVNNAKTATLAQVGKPAWDGWAITWNDDANDVANVEDYEIKLYRDNLLIVTKIVNPGVKRWDFSADTAAAGSYTATVQALGDMTVYLDGPVSEKSDPNIRKVKLAQVGKPTWSDPGVIGWTAVENAGSYRVELLKNGSDFKTETTANLTCNFLTAMREEGGAGSYTVKVTALAVVESFYEDGDASAPSDAQVVVKILVGKPALSDQGVATWDKVTNVQGYKVHLYKDGLQADAQTINDPDTLSYDFLAAMREEGAGSYTVTVTALGTGLYLSSDESAHSDAKTAVQLAAPANLSWKSETEPLLTWGNVTGAAGYRVQLYKGGVAVGDPVEAADGAAGYGFTTTIGDAAGYYTARVQAVGEGLNLDSPYSDISDTFTKTGPLGQVTNLNLSDRGVLTWVDEPDADGFELQLYKGGDKVGDARTVAPGVQSANFRDAMRSSGVASYYVSVIAKGSGLFTDGPALDSNSQAVSKLEAPAVSFSETGVSSWGSVDNATQYWVRLYLPAGHPYDQNFQTYWTGSLSLNHLSLMREYPGDYYIGIWAQDIYGLHLDSDESQSETRTVIKPAQVGKPALTDDGNAEWTDVADGVSYEVSLYKGIELVATKTVVLGVQSCSFLDEIKAAGSGIYTVTVTALGDEYLILDGEPSEESDPVTARVLPKMNRPVWAIEGETGEITLEWEDIEGATGYRIIVYNGNVDEPEVFEVEGTSLTFLPEKPGFYWATVQPLGLGVTLDGPASDRSDVLVSFERGYLIALQQNNSETSYSADGMLPVSGYLWMQITSATGQDGIMTIERSATSAHVAPEGLTAAGIFFNIELDENLSGSHVILAAGYDPAELPERMDAASLCFYRYDAEKGWMLLKSEVDTTEKLVSAEIAEFSTVGIFGKVSAAPVEPPKDDKPKDDLPRTFGYISYLLLAGLILAAAGMLFFMRRKRLESR